MNEKRINSCQINNEISRMWDANVMIRAADLEQNTDYTYINIIKPWVIEKIKKYASPQNDILDIGCGCGYLTNEVYQLQEYNIDAIDISASSIEYAKNKYPQIDFTVSDIAEYKNFKKYNICLAIMLLNNMPDLDSFFQSVRKIIKKNGIIIIIIPHPYFWTEKHLNLNEYDYNKEKPYEFCFSTKGRKDYVSNILFFHRKVETYNTYIEKYGFQILEYQELKEKQDQINPEILGIVLKKSN